MSISFLPELRGHACTRRRRRERERERVAGDIDEVSHNKRAGERGKNETIMIMQRERYESLDGGRDGTLIVRIPTRVFFRVTPHAARLEGVSNEHRLIHWTSQAEFCVKVNGAHKSAYNKIAPARICLLVPNGSNSEGGGRNRAPLRESVGGYDQKR